MERSGGRARCGSSAMRFPVWLTKAGAHLRARGPLVLAVGLAATVTRAALPAPPPRTVEGVAAMLGREAGGEVRPDGFIWEERGGLLSDALLGRRVLFIASVPGPGGAAAGDLFRARVRLTRAGRPISLHGLRNLTQTPLGDDRDLVARGRYAGFVTVAFGAVQGVTLLDLAGDWAQREARTRRERAQASLEGWLDAGVLRGIGRTEVSFGAPPAEVKLDVADGALVMALGPEARSAALDAQTGTLTTGDTDPFLARAKQIPHPVRPFDAFAVELARRALGEPAARVVSSALDARSRLASRERGGAAEAMMAADPQAAAVAVPSDGSGWPPARIEPPVSPAWPGEGIWVPVRSPFPLPAEPPAPVSSRPPVVAVPREEPRGAPDAPPDARPDAGGGESEPDEPEETDAPDAPSVPDSPNAPNAPSAAPRPPPGPPPDPEPAFYEAVIRPEPAEPRAVVRLLAMDMRQLELRMEAGFEVPRPVVGPRGTGKLPSGPAAARVVAAFAGGAPAGSPSFGMVVGRRILVPPAPGAETVAVLRDGSAALGPWPFGAEVPEGVVALRQSPLALIENGAPVAPLSTDGDAASAERAERAALCVTRAGHVVYAWGPELSAKVLAKALALAGCQTGAHLGMSPSPSGFAFVRAREGTWDAKLLAPAMSLPADRLSGALPVDLFYLVQRSLKPSVPLPGDARWELDGGRMPQPAWLPAIYTASVANLGAEVRVTSFAPGRFSWRVRAGARELSHRFGGTFPGALDPEEQARAAAAIGLGTSRRKGMAPRGLAISGSVGLSFRGDVGAIVAGERGLAVIRSAELPLLSVGDIVELPLTADDGKLLPAGRQVGSRRPRAAMCALADGTVLVATATFDSDEAATGVLLELGCGRVVALDRGSHQAAFVHRAGTDTEPRARYEASALYAVERPMRGRAQTFAQE